MTDITLGLESLIKDIRELRLMLAERRAHDLSERYPEVELGEIKPLRDGEIVREALKRELAHQRRVVEDINR